MNASSHSKWPTLVFLSTCGLFFFGCVWYLWAGALNPEYYWEPPTINAADAADPALEKEGRILLVKNRGVRVGDARVVYRGLQGGALHLEYIVLKLDPHYGYPHLIDAGQARTGFSMGEHQFKVLAASDGKISLKLL